MKTAPINLSVDYFDLTMTVTMEGIDVMLSDVPILTPIIVAVIEGLGKAAATIAANMTIKNP